LLQDFCKLFQQSEKSPSKVLKRIAFIAGAAANSQRSQIGWLVVNAIVPWDLYFAWRLENLKSELRHTLRDWLQRWYELEALGSLANFAYLNPEAIYPEILSDPQDPEFNADQIGHPLIHPAERVCNDFSLKNAGDVVLITGSNMSGKSTFLRTLGVNLVLTYAGAPVIANSLRTTPFRLFTCIQISDSLSDGISYFYAEVKRLKRLLTAYHEDHHYPLFFLIDEIFRGTNNRERLIGSRAVIRALTQGRGFGAIATHDLELTSLEDEITHISNYHFREHISDGKLEFDYTLRDGPCPTTNALKIMQHEGLPVD
jgi:DNA mismatch repair ATPase MutS